MIDTIDINVRQHCCYLCRYYVYDIGRGNICTITDDVIKTTNALHPNDCNNFER